MSVTRKDVEYIAELARLKFTDEELDSYTDQLNEILGYMEKLNELDTENVEPLSYPVEIKDALRDDIPGVSVSTEEALKNAPDHDGQHLKVPKVISQE